jgi:hypothetical protein
MGKILDALKPPEDIGRENPSTPAHHYRGDCSGCCRRRCSADDESRTKARRHRFVPGTRSLALVLVRSVLFHLCQSNDIGLHS